MRTKCAAHDLFAVQHGIGRHADPQLQRRHGRGVDAGGSSPVWQERLDGERRR